jgi:hypothetical protein
MSLVRPIRKSSRGLVSYRVLIMCVAALSLLLARSAPPSLPHISLSLAVNSQADHDHRQCFDHEDSQWATSPRTSLTTPPPVVSPHPTPTAEPFVEIVTGGWHYNRPPPIS